MKCVAPQMWLVIIVPFYSALKGLSIGMQFKLDLHVSDGHKSSTTHPHHTIQGDWKVTGYFKFFITLKQQKISS